MSIDQSLSTLLTITQIPTAAGREWRVIDWITRWVAQRPDLALSTDAAGNMTIAPREQWGSGESPILITAHLDHPAFVVERIIAPTIIELAFRGGVRDHYFESARIAAHPRSGPPIAAALTGSQPPTESGFNRYLAELDEESTTIQPGDVASWFLPPAEIDSQGLVHTHACDDLAALAAALCAFDELRARRASGEKVEDVRLLFTRSEEIGFTGALAACKVGTIPPGSRIIALENSRSFPDSPLGAGPIVRVGDRMSIFTPDLTAACAKRAEELATSRPPLSTPPALPLFSYQRKLMSGGACEATVFCAFGHHATCICLPLGNYHNMADLAQVETNTFDRSKGPPRVAREYIHKDDYLNLIALLVAIGQHLPTAPAFLDRLENLYTKHKAVLDER